MKDKTIKVGDEVRITAKDEDLLYIPSYSRIPILKSKKGIIYKIFKDGYEIRFETAGIWFIKKEYVKEK